jgi:hypothetical protein
MMKKISTKMNLMIIRKIHAIHPKINKNAITNFPYSVI